MSEIRFIDALITLVILCTLMGCGRQASAPDAGDAKPSQGSAPVRLTLDSMASAKMRIEPVAERPLMHAVAAAGNLDYDADHMSPVSARVPGRVVEITVDLGQSIFKGQVLCLIDSPDAGAAQATYLKALSDLNLKQKAYDRSTQLMEGEAISRGELLERQAAWEAAKSELAVSENHLHLLGFDQDEIERLRTASQGEVHAVFPVRSPISGRLVERKASPGLIVDPTTELFKVADLSRLWFDLHLPEKDISRVQTGQRVTITVAAYPGESFDGILDYLGDVVEPESRMVTARVILNNPGARLKPGMYAEAVVHVPVGRTAVVLPEGAIQELGGQSVVFVKRSDGSFEARTVMLGEKSGDQTEIRDGLKVGEDVVTEGGFTLKAEALKASFGEE